MSHKLLEVLPRLLQLQHEHNSLLRPIARLQQIVHLERGIMAPMREVLVHSLGIEIPHRCPRHHVQSKGPEDGKVPGRVRLLHESILLSTGFHARVDGHGADDPLHEKLTRKGEDDDVKGHKGEVFSSFAIVGLGGVAGVQGDERMISGEGVRQKDGAVQRI